MYDAVIIGAGLAGLTCARRLAMKGLRVLLVDRKPSVASQIHTTGIFVRKTWEDFALPDEQLGAPIRDVILYSPRRRALQLTADHDEFRIGRMAWIYLWLLEQCSRAGVEWLPSTRFVSASDGRVTLERRGHAFDVAARFVVGADGARSLVARQFGLDRNREMLAGVEEVFPSRGGAPVLHCYLDPRIAPGYIAWVADDGEEVHAGVAGYPDRFDVNRAFDEFRRSIDLPSHALERRGGLIPVGGILGRIGCERALLVGDAAGAVSPLTAGGLDAAIRLSLFAADVIAAALDGDRTAIAAYDGRRFRARFLARRWMRHLLRMFEHPVPMELVCALLRTPPLRALASHVFFSRGSFPDVAFTPRRLRSLPIR